MCLFKLKQVGEDRLSSKHSILVTHLLIYWLDYLKYVDLQFFIDCKLVNQQ